MLQVTLEARHRLHFHCVTLEPMGDWSVALRAALVFIALDLRFREAAYYASFQMGQAAEVRNGWRGE
ncbi:MAG: hypothetical protein AMS18_13310 [Gemmatimonas sp. SG8_17]|nr:MAG: hypothetical protein AMS18_13310 [Gemmatimonas sp. SG8_17]